MGGDCVVEADVDLLAGVGVVDAVNDVFGDGGGSDGGGEGVAFFEGDFVDEVLGLRSMTWRADSTTARLLRKFSLRRICMTLG